MLKLPRFRKLRMSVKLHGNYSRFFLVIFVNSHGLLSLFLSLGSLLLSHLLSHLCLLLHLIEALAAHFLGTETLFSPELKT